MGYRIVYGPENVPKRFRKKSKIFSGLMTVLVLLGLILGVCHFWNTKQDFIKNILFPGQPDVTQTALQNMITSIREGDSVSDAVSVFCREIVDHARLQE